MNKVTDHTVVLRRVNYAERDRIVTALARESGKVTLFAKGARLQTSKLSAGIELLNINEVSFASGKGGLKTMTGSRIIKSNQDIVKDLGRTSLVFESLKLLNKIIEDNEGQEFYNLLVIYLDFMNRYDYDFRICEIWFRLKVLATLGLLSDLEADSSGQNFNFDWDTQKFITKDKGLFNRDDIKFLRLLKNSDQPIKLAKPLGSEDELINFSRLLLESLH